MAERGTDRVTDQATGRLTLALSGSYTFGLPQHRMSFVVLVLDIVLRT